MNNDSSVSAHIKTLYKFFLTKDPEYHSLETKIHVQLTRIVYRTFTIISSLISIFTQKSLANIAVILMTGLVIQLVMTEKTLTLMKLFSVVGACGVTIFRFFLIGPETAIFNHVQCAITPFIILTWTNSIPLTGLAFVYSFTSTRMIVNFLDQENAMSPIILEKAFIYFKQNYQVLNFIAFMLVFILVCQKQTLLAHIWARQQEKDALLREIQAKNKELEELNKSKTRLLLGLSHEFRNPINAALGNLELADEKVTDPTVQKYLSNCKASIELIFHLVSNLLDSTKMEAGILEQNLLHKKSNIIFDKVWGVIKNSLDKKNLIGELYIHREIPQILNIDSHFVVKIMLNIILNAAKYTQEGGVMTVVTWLDTEEFSETLLQPSERFYSKFLDNFTRKKRLQRKAVTLPIPNFQKAIIQNQAQQNSSVTNDPSNIPIESARARFLSVENTPVNPPSIKIIESFQSASQQYEKFSNHQESKDLNTSKNLIVRTRSQAKKKGYLKIEVYDSGCGMDSHIIKDVIFQKFSTVSLETGDRLGLGLGLWLTKNLCESMNGQLRAFSEKDKGSQFIAVIPMESPDHINSDGLKPCMKGPLTALVVDDDKFNRDINTTFLTRSGVIVKAEAADGQEAVEIFMSQPPNYFDFIVMDLEMPVMGGKEASKKIREYERQQNRVPTKIVVATGNCDLAEYVDCMKPGGDIRADLFYRKPLLNKDVEEIVEILQREKARQNTCLTIGINEVTNELLRNFLKKNRAEQIAVDSVGEALKMFTEYQINVRWVVMNLSLRSEEIINMANMVTRVSMQSKRVDMIVFNEVPVISRISFCRDLGINKFLNSPFSNFDLTQMFGIQ